MSVHRWKIESDSIAAVVVTPTWSGEIDYSLENDAVFFRAKSGELKFQKEDYTAIHDAPDCELIEVYLEERCDATWVEQWRGTFTTYDCKFDENKCVARVTPKPKDDYVCTLTSWTDEYLVRAGSPIIARPIAGTYEAGVGCCSECVPFGDPIPTDPVCDVPDDYCFDKNTSEYEHDGPLCEYLVTSCFHRIVGQGTGTGATPPTYGTGWTYISGDDWWRCPDDVETEIPVFDQGRVFNDCLELLVSQYPCGLTVRSHFFGLNAIHDAAPSNDAYDFAIAKLQALQLHQKSDVKRPFATNPAQSFVWKMSLKKLLDDLRVIFNVYWKIDGTDLILEHFSYFAEAAGLDLTETNIAIEYGKQEASAPNVENFKWMDLEATFTETHKGWPISYGDCGDGKLDHRVNYFSNDIFYIYTVENQEEIADAGFCLVATEVIDGQNIIIENNDCLGWEQLHENLHKHRRFFLEGNMNDTPATTFLSSLKTRKLNAFTVKVCCDDVFDLTDSIDTLAGVASVQKATFNYFAGHNARMVKIDAIV